MVNEATDGFPYECNTVVGCGRCVLLYDYFYLFLFVGSLCMTP